MQGEKISGSAIRSFIIFLIISKRATDSESSRSCLMSTFIGFVVYPLLQVHGCFQLVEALTIADYRSFSAFLLFFSLYRWSLQAKRSLFHLPDDRLLKIVPTLFLDIFEKTDYSLYQIRAYFPLTLYFGTRVRIVCTT